MTSYDCPECGRKQIVWWDARARAFLCGAHGCTFSARAPAGQCACGDDREHVAKLLSRGRASVTPAWMAKQGGVPCPSR